MDRRHKRREGEEHKQEFDKQKKNMDYRLYLIIVMFSFSVKSINQVNVIVAGLNFEFQCDG